MSWDVAIRLINGTGCFVALYFLAVAAWKQWDTWSIKTQDHWWALVGWVFLGGEGSVESIILGTEPGPRTIIQTLIVAFTLRAILRSGEVRAESSFPGKKKE